MMLKHAAMTLADILESKMTYIVRRMWVSSKNWI